MPHVLVVEDDLTVAEVVVSYLRRAGLEATHVAAGGEALTVFGATHPDLVVLDLMLPTVDGLEVCRRLRALEPPHNTVPVVMLTAMGEEEDRVAGLVVGADDYVTKPFSPRELVLRVQSVLRRSSNGPERGLPGTDAPETLVDGDLTVDVTGHRVTLRDAELSLTAREYDLLTFLLRHPDQAFSRAELMERVWGWTYGDQSTVTVHVRRLREKVEADPAQPERLATVWGVGYRWDPRDA
jgi:DNA-binding response OmpR family regulator